MSRKPKETNLSRREFIRFATLSTATLTSSCIQQVHHSSSAKKRLNIIFLLTDDQRAQTLSVSGHPIIKTPNLDLLAFNGIRFTNAFVTDPTCMPSRITFLTGLYERIHGVGFSSKHVLTQEQWSYTYPALLRENGYYTGFIGKFGVERYPFRGSPLKEFDFWQGHSLIKLIHDSETDWRKYIFIENLYTGRFNPLIEAVREKRWKYIRYFPNPGHNKGKEVLTRSGYYVDEDIDFRGKIPFYEQLFNLRTDPHENNNLVKNSRYTTILNRLRQRCEFHSSHIMVEKEKYRMMFNKIK